MKSENINLKNEKKFKSVYKDKFSKLCYLCIILLLIMCISCEYNRYTIIKSLQLGLKIKYCILQ